MDHVTENENILVKIVKGTLSLIVHGHDDHSHGHSHDGQGHGHSHDHSSHGHSHDGHSQGHSHDGQSHGDHSSHGHSHNHDRSKSKDVRGIMKNGPFNELVIRDFSDLPGLYGFITSVVYGYGIKSK